MSYALPQILQPAIIQEIVSRLRLSNTSLQKFWGIQSGGPNREQTPSRRTSYDVFNDSRKVAHGRMPGATMGTFQPNPVGNVPVVIPRVAYKIPLLSEIMQQMRPIGGPASQVDNMGDTYIAHQTKIAAEYIANVKEFQAAAVFRGSYGWTPAGDDLVHGFTGTYTVNYGIPSGNTAQLNMVGGGSIIDTAWSNASAAIPTHLYAIDSAFTQLCGRRLTDIWLGYKEWNNVLNNTAVHTLAGTAARPFNELARDAGDSNNFTCTLAGVPFVNFRVTNQGLDLYSGGAWNFTKLIDDNSAAFIAEPGPDVLTLYETGEAVNEYMGQQPTFRYGEYYFAKPSDDPTGFMLCGIYNALPALKNPNAIAYGTVNF